MRATGLRGAAFAEINAGVGDIAGPIVRQQADYGCISDLVALLTAAPICEAKWVFSVFLSFDGPIVTIRSCVRVRPVEKSGRLPLLEVTRTNFQTGLTFPDDTITNLISILIVSGASLFVELLGSMDGRN